MSAPQMTLGQAIQQTFASHPKILFHISEKKIEKTRLRQATGRFWPTVDLSVSAGGQRLDQLNGLSASRNANWNFDRQATAEIG